MDDSRSSLSRLRLDAITKSLTPSLDGSRRRRFMPATPSPRVKRRRRPHVHIHNNGIDTYDGSLLNSRKLKSLVRAVACKIGEAIKVLKALEAVIRHLRKVLVDRSVLPLFEKTNVAAAAPQEQQVETSWANKPMMRTADSQLRLGGADYAFPMRRETLFLDREPPQRESFLTSQGLSLYGHDHALSTVLPTTRSARIARTGGPFVTQMVNTRTDADLSAAVQNALQTLLPNTKFTLAVPTD
nr:RNA-binding KH domain-containing protein PEPPER-like [Tanacetum cinerariifolium]